MDEIKKKAAEGELEETAEDITPQDAVGELGQDAAETHDETNAAETDEASARDDADEADSDAAAVKKKRTFKVSKKPDGETSSGRRADAPGPTDDIEPDEAEKRTYRVSGASDAEDGARQRQKRTYRSDIEDYDETDDGEAHESVFQYKPEGEKSKLWPKIVACVAALAALVAALAVFLPEGNPISGFFNSFASSPLERRAAVMTVDGREVSSDLYLHFILSGKAQLDDYYPGYLEANPDMFVNLKTLTENELRAMAARSRLADELGLGLDDADNAEVDSYIEETRASYISDLDYDNALTNNLLTEELYRELLADSLLYNKLRSKAAELPEYSAVSAEQAEEYVKANDIMAAQHILLLAPQGTDEAAKAQKLALANEIAAKLAAGGDFKTLMLEYTEDPSVDAYPDGYTFGPGEMVPEFEAAVKALGSGEVSGVVESSYGYHIIKRVEPDYAELTTQIIAKRIDAKLEEYAADAQVKYARGYDRITLEQCVWPYSTQTASTVAPPEEQQTEQPSGSEAAEIEETTE